MIVHVGVAHVMVRCASGSADAMPDFVYPCMSPIFAHVLRLYGDDVMYVWWMHVGCMHACDATCVVG